MTKSQKGLVTCCLVGILGAVGAYYLAKEQDRIRNLYGDRPQMISVADLAAKGYGDNVWVDLTDAEVGKKYVISMRKRTISAAWVPAFPRGEANNARTIKVVLRCTKCKTEEEVAQRFFGRSSFRGAVINPTLLTPHDPYRPYFQEQYPNLPLEPTVWEVDVDYTDKPSEQWAKGFYAGAAGLGVFGVICGVALLFTRRETP